MKMSIGDLDAEIREVEKQLAIERAALDQAVNAVTSSVRDTVTSPKTLLALTGVGYAMGKMMFSGNKKEKAEPVKKAGVIGALTGLAGTAIGLMQPKSGVGSIARWAATRAFAKRKAAAAAAPAAQRQAPAASAGYARSTAASATYPQTKPPSVVNAPRG